MASAAAQVIPINDDPMMRRLRAWRPYVEAKLGFRNHWYPVLLAADIADGEYKAVQVLAEKILIKRSGEKLFAVRDRCLHRGVPLSVKPECVHEGSVTCWYHGWTYDLATGNLVTIVSNPDSSQIGRHKLRTFPVQEAQGLIFVFVGDIDAPALADDVPPGFLDSDYEVGAEIQTVKANWRLGVENGFDAGHIWIHKHSKLVHDNDLALPLGFSPPEGTETAVRVVEDHGPKGVIDMLGERSMPVFEAYFEDKKLAEGRFGENRVANEVSIWLPAALKVDPWPQEGMVQFEWYVPVDEVSHLYVTTLAKRVTSDEERVKYRKAFKDKWQQLCFHEFNDDDVWAREAGQEFYSETRGWLEEILYEPDLAIVEWRKFASEHNRGLQTREHLFG